MSDENAVNLLIGARIRELRKAAKRTQADVAEAAGCARSTFANIETGKQGMSAARLADVAKALDVHPGDLFSPVTDPGLPVRRAALAEAIAGMHRRVVGQHAEIAELVERHMAAVQRELDRIGRVLPEIATADHG